MGRKQKELTTFTEKLSIHQMSGYFNILTLHSRFMAVNTASANLMGYSHAEEVTLTTYEDMPCRASESATLFKAEDEKVITLKEPLRILSYQCFSHDRWTVLIGQKWLLFGNDGEPIGIASHFMDVTHLNIVDLGRFMWEKTKRFSAQFYQKQFSYVLSPIGFFSKLSQRQMECLFFMIRGYSSNEIARSLQLSVRTIHDHIDELKNKFSTQNKKELIEKAIFEGFVNVLPPSLIKQV